MRYLERYLVVALLAVTMACKEDKKMTGAEEVSLDEATRAIDRTDSADAKLAEDPEVKQGLELLDKCLAAHGGMDIWNSYQALEYELDDNGKQVYQLTHLKDRRAYIKSKNYTVGFDGETAWAVPDATEVSGTSAAFYYDLDFYFFGIPFLLKDPGVNITYSGTAEVGGKAYESLKVTFGTDIGLTPGDVYFLYIDPESYMMEILTYSISYFDANAPVNSAKVYSEYEEVQGLKMPTKMENFEWDADALEMGASKNHVRLFSDIRFLKKVPDEEVFEVPDTAVRETVGS